MVPRVVRPFHRRRAVIVDYVAGPESVPVLRDFLPRVALGIGVGRVALGATFLAAPVLSVRVLGMDVATAKRIAFLARMTAARDIGIGMGTVVAGSNPRVVPWLVAGAAADTVDAVAIAAAIRQGSARAVPAAGIVAGAALTAVAALWAALGLRRVRG